MSDSVDSKGEQLWLDCLSLLAQDIPEHQFNTWIQPLAATVSDDLSRLTLLVANRFKLDWIRAQYSAKIAAALQQLAGIPIAVELALAPKEAVFKPSSARSPEVTWTHAGIDPGVDKPLDADRNRLNTSLSFDNLVEGSANRMARAAAMHVAGSPGQLYNPLFIYGGVGLGKTHLMHAVGNQLVHDTPQAKVLYIHAEQFVSDVVKAYQRKTFDEFKARYHSL
ncbi:MAG: hypothetical protein RLZZ126_1759, partial [Pseudomonadota bacterium]